MNGILLIDKPAGISSFGVIRILQKRLGRLKMGHAGTLDPIATGLLIIGIGDATKKLSAFLKLPKTYTADILLGVSTDTGDITGRALTYSISTCREEEIADVVKGLLGTLSLPVSLYSAKKIGGKSLYKYARAGRTDIPIPIHEMQVYEAALGQCVSRGSWHHTEVLFRVGSGTYIRSLAQEMGERLGIPTTLASLRRLSIGPYQVAHAKSPDDVTAADVVPLSADGQLPAFIETLPPFKSEV